MRSLSLKSAPFSIQAVFSLPRFAISHFQLPRFIFPLLFNYYFGCIPESPRHYAMMMKNRIYTKMRFCFPFFSFFSPFFPFSFFFNAKRVPAWRPLPPSFTGAILFQGAISFTHTSRAYILYCFLHFLSIFISPR